MQIRLLKPLDYDPRNSGAKTFYMGYTQVGLGKSDPSIKQNYYNSSRQNSKAITSCSLRSKQTALALGYTITSKKRFLNEVVFDLTKLLTQSEFELHGSCLVRERFAEAFTHDLLVEKRHHIQERMNAIIECMKEFDEDTTYFSHSFTMKIFEAYVDTNFKLFNNPELIKNYLHRDRLTYPYGKGIRLNI